MFLRVCVAVIALSVLCCLHRLCSRCMTKTRVVLSATTSLSPSPPTFPSLSASLFLTKTSEAVHQSLVCVLASVSVLDQDK